MRLSQWDKSNRDHRKQRNVLTKNLEEKETLLSG